MLGYVRAFRAIFPLAALVLASAAAGTMAVAEAPQRVVSVNLCTDQLALILAAPDQLISVSRLAHDPDSSAMVEAARNLPTNGSGAEEAYLLAPDLVLAGTYTSSDTVQMLRNLGVRVEIFAPAQSLSDIPALLTQMGAALGREDEAATQIAAFRAELSTLDDAPEQDRKSVV